jgi:DNA repair exonuclease SbcCD nuclease subunit
LHVFRSPETVLVERAGLRVAFAGLPHLRDVRSSFARALAATGYRDAPADARVLCLHQCVEGATCGPPPGFTFRDGGGVVPARALPGDVAVVLCGHVHRHQVLRRDLSGRPLPAPVVYAGSVERTSFAEREETKGYVVATIAGGGAGGRLAGLTFHPLPTRPMRVHEIEAADAGAVEHQVREAIAAAPEHALLQLRVPGELLGAQVLRAARLRALAPPTVEVTVAPRGAGSAKEP